MNKKGLQRLIVPVLFLGFIAFIAIFMYLFRFSVGSLLVIPAITNASLDVLELNGNDTGAHALIVGQQSNFDNFDIGLDVLFLVYWVATILSTAVAAYSLPKISKFNFITLLFFGGVLMLLFMNFLAQIFEWFVSAFITNIFESGLTYLPIFSFYADNYIIISFLHIMLLLFINQISFKEESSLVEDGFDGDTNFGGIQE